LTQVKSSAVRSCEAFVRPTRRGAEDVPYASNADLPPGVQRHLPPHAQDIFRSAFNHAWEEYGEAEPERIEEIAHRVAWAAVKKRYRKLGSWVERDGSWGPLRRSGSMSRRCRSGGTGAPIRSRFDHGAPEPRHATSSRRLPVTAIRAISPTSSSSCWPL
jgi:cation transport regulator